MPKPIVDDDVEAGGKQVIARAAAVLRALEENSKGVSLAQVVRSSGLPRTTANRIVQALEAQQLVVTTSTGLRLGPALTRLAASAHTDVVGLARPHIETLGRRLRETVHCSVLRGRHMIVVDQFESDQELRVTVNVGQAQPLHCTAHGQVILAALSDAEVERLLNGELEQRTSNTIVSIAALSSRLDQIRKRGLGIDLEEHADGVCAFGMAIDVGSSDHYAISVAAPTKRFNSQVDLFEAALWQCKAAIEAGLRSKDAHVLMNEKACQVGS